MENVTVSNEGIIKNILDLKYDIPQIIIELQQPLNNSIVNSQQPIFKWVDVEAAEKYEIIVFKKLCIKSSNKDEIRNIA